MSKGSTSSALKRWCCVAFIGAIAGTGVAQTDVPVTREQLIKLQQQNESLQQQLRKQQELIDSLSKKVSEIQAVQDRQAVPARSESAPATDAIVQPPAQSGGFRFGKVNLGAEGGLAFFHSQAKGKTPNAEFRVDEAKIFIEAPIWNEVYFFSETDLTTREAGDLNLHLSQLYLDFENVPQLWGSEDGTVKLRVGKFYTPFGEEYQQRYAIDNPLISHSISDLWGVNNGLEVFGSLGKFSYAAAVQNGGNGDVRDFNADKAIAGRIGWDPLDWLHASVSGMRTGDIDVKNDTLSAMWFGDGFFKSIGSTNTTRFCADLVEGDLQFKFPWLVVKTAGGYVRYSDNDPKANNTRNITYYYVEATKDLGKHFYTGARFSQLFVPDGYLIVGGGPLGNFFNPYTTKTTEYWRLSLGLGYRFSRDLVIKAEYSLNHGTDVQGAGRNQENTFALEAAFRF